MLCFSERTGLEAKLRLAKDWRKELQEQLAAKEEEGQIARTAIASLEKELACKAQAVADLTKLDGEEMKQLLANMQHLKSILPVLKCELMFQQWQSTLLLDDKTSAQAGHQDGCMDRNGGVD